MNKGTVILGVIIIIVGVYLIAYNEKIFLYSEPGFDRQWVPPEQVDSMKAQEWEEVGSLNGDVLMIKQITWDYYATSYPYQIIGAIVALIGFVTSIIGTQLDSR